MSTEVTGNSEVVFDDCGRRGNQAGSPGWQHPPPPHVGGCRPGDQWSLHEYAEVTSTNLIAAQLPVWHAVRADTQTAGRGRFQRSWISDAGGLWLSAVVPAQTNSPAWRMLPLAAGLAVYDALSTMGVKQLRLRWPNDVLVGNRKLAGLLIDQFQPGLAVVGIGINVANEPQTRDATLNGLVVRLADLISPAPSVRELAVCLLASLRTTWLAVQNYGPQEILPRVNALWDLPRRVQVDIDGTLVQGDFAGVDVKGRLRLRRANEATEFFDPQDVKLLRDIPTGGARLCPQGQPQQGDLPRTAAGLGHSRAPSET